tara:strand:+ start:239 stop:907 length:669 start_codon:yes stop_codon:yes gene_type:complete
MVDLKSRIENLIGQVSSGTKGAISDMEMQMFKNATSPNVNDNEPRFGDRSPEGMMFSIESQIENMMREYEMAVRDGDNQRAQMIANQINKLDEEKIKIQSSKGNAMRATDSGLARLTKGAISDREMDMFNKAVPRFAEGGMAQMSQQEGMAEIEMSKEEAMQEIFIPLAENGYQQEVMAILNNPIDSEVSMQAQQVLAQVLSQDPEFDMEDFQMAVSLVAPQ